GLSLVVKDGGLKSCVSGGQKDSGKILIFDADPGKRSVFGQRSILGGLGLFAVYFIRRGIVVNFAFLRRRIGNGQIAETASPGEKIGQRLSVRSGGGLDLQQVTVALETERFGGRYPPARILKGEAQSVRGLSSLEQGLIEVDRRFCVAEFVMEGVPGFRHGSGVDDIQRLAGMVGELLEGPAFY